METPATSTAGSEASAAVTGTPGAGEQCRRIVDVLVAPVQTFQQIAARPTWLAPLVLWLLAAGLLAAAVTPKLDLARVMREQAASRGIVMSDAQIQQALDLQHRFRWLGYAGVMVTPVVTAGLVSLVFFAAFTVAGAKSLSYRQAFGVSTHAFLPQILASFGGAVVAWRMDTIDPRNVGDLVCSSPVCLAGGGLTPLMHAALQSLDIYVIWTLILLVIGYAAAAKVSRGLAAGIVGSTWIVYVVLKVAVSGLFG
ncbi:MAG TPA: YIP1 family protein [Vicinamibacterales bacterium]|nr:YIP1 family protein [Vicinamibacterales bacterium]